MCHMAHGSGFVAAKGRKNANTLASALLKRKCRLVSVTNATNNHMLLWDLSTLGLIGTPAMTSRGCIKDGFETIADFLFRAAQITCIVQREHGKSCKDFLQGLENNENIIELKNQVETFASQFTNRSEIILP